MRKIVVSGKEVMAVLMRIGFQLHRTKGSHVRLVRTTNGRTYNVTIPIHANRDLNPTVLRSIMKQSGLTPEEFEKLF